VQFEKLNVSIWPAEWVALLVVSLPVIVLEVHVVSAMPAFKREEPSKDMLKAAVYSVPVGDVKVAAEALPANAVSEAAAITRRPSIFRCFMLFLLGWDPKKERAARRRPSTGSENG